MPQKLRFDRTRLRGQDHETRGEAHARLDGRASARVLFILPLGTSVLILGERGAWRLVRVGSRVGSVHVVLLKPRAAMDVKYRWDGLV